MKKFTTITFVLLSIFVTTKTYSQGDLSIHLGPAIPVADFGSDDEEDAGGAAVGFNAGLQYIHPISESGLGLFGGIDINYNALQKDIKDDLEEEFNGYDADIKFSKYINIPITAGVNYTYQSSTDFGLFVNAGLALNFLKITNTEVEVYGQTATSEMDVASNLGFKIGGGILINENTSISIDYLGLGEYDLKGEVKANGYSEDIEGELKVDLLTLTVGFRL